MNLEPVVTSYEYHSIFLHLAAMPAAAAAVAAAAVEGGEGGVTRESTGAVVDSGSVQISEQDDRLYRHITLPNKMQVDTGSGTLVLLIAALSCLVVPAGTSVRLSDSTTAVAQCILICHRDWLVASLQSSTPICGLLPLPSCIAEARFEKRISPPVWNLEHAGYYHY